MKYFKGLYTTYKNIKISLYTINENIKISLKILKVLEIFWIRCLAICISDFIIIYVAFWTLYSRGEVLYKLLQKNFQQKELKYWKQLILINKKKIEKKEEHFTSTKRTFLNKKNTFQNNRYFWKSHKKLTKYLFVVFGIVIYIWLNAIIDFVWFVTTSIHKKDDHS